tara:strand:+ start:605 stop:991 length:387 start_codon:yes stop_codon:yes gene_type:complete
MTEQKEEKSKYFYTSGRNGWTYTTTEDTISGVQDENREIELSVPEGYEFNKAYDIKVDRIPDYYKGKDGYMARKVVENFDLNYNIGTAVTYLLRAQKKHETPTECIKKAIDHLKFELEKINNEKDNKS